MDSSKKVYIVGAARTGIGSFLGAYETIPAVNLGATVVSAALERANVKKDDVDEVILGHVLTAGLGQNPARQTVIKASLPQTVPAYTVNKLCGSGLKAVELGFLSIKGDTKDIIVTGGQENMTRAQHTQFIRGKASRMGPITMQDSMILDGLTDAFNGVHMGNTAENLAVKYNVSREKQDEYAANSQNKCEQAQKNGHFNAEIVAVKNEKGQVVLDKDEFPKAGVTITSLSSFRPAFDRSKGTVTPGNASGINDGAAAVVLASGAAVQQKGLKPLAEVIGFAEGGLDPMEMGLGPEVAVNLLLKKLKWDKESVDLWELNEAFAVQSVLCVERLGLNPEKVNINGGAIAIGHPIGASGARVLVTLLHNLIRLNKKRGVAALCIGGGMGIACAIENTAV